jgi:hypothetical protein
VARWLVVRRGRGVDAVVVVGNFSDREVDVPLAGGPTSGMAYVVAFATPGTGLAVGSAVSGRLELPAHTGVLLRPDLG